MDKKTKIEYNKLVGALREEHKLLITIQKGHRAMDQLNDLYIKFHNIGLEKLCPTPLDTLLDGKNRIKEIMAVYEAGIKRNENSLAFLKASPYPLKPHERQKIEKELAESLPGFRKIKLRAKIQNVINKICCKK